MARSFISRGASWRNVMVTSAPQDSCVPEATKKPHFPLLPISQLLNMVDRGALAIRSDFRDLFNVQRIISKPRPNSEMEVVQSGLNLGDLLRELVRNTVQGLRQGGEFGK